MIRERAEQLAAEALIHSDHPLERVIDAILQACREQREEDAKVGHDFVRDHTEHRSHTPAECALARDIADAIRELVGVSRDCAEPRAGRKGRV